MARKKYLAYSFNLSLKKMMALCPHAKLLGYTDIEEHRLVFGGGTQDAVATIDPAPGFSVPATIWKITPEDEEILDNHKEFEWRFIKKEYEVWLRGDRIMAMAYVMAPGYYIMGAPNEKYLAELRKAYDEIGIDQQILDEAVAYSTELYNKK